LELSLVQRGLESLPLGELQRTVSGLLTFDKYLEQFGAKIPTNVDIKRAGYEYEVVGALRRHDLTGQVLISSRNVMSLRRIKFLAPESQIGVSRGQVVPWLDREPHSAIAASILRPTLMAQLPAQGALAMADTFMLNDRLITPWLVDYLHACGFRVSCWTVNDPETVRWLIDTGVDYIATDYPARVVQFLRG
ncbi:MAG: glycerophosphodiester phosphodiesterase, partial [Thermomicrobiaceae bacterium]